MNFRCSKFTITTIIVGLLLIPPELIAGQNKDEERIQSPDDWQLILQPDGRLWVWQYLKAQPTVHWDFGAQVDMEIARGHHHRIWFGAKYRVAAAYKIGQSVTPFDPKHIDSYQLLTWNWEPVAQRQIFIHAERYCYHEIDEYKRHAQWLTSTMFGIGTMSPPQQGEVLANPHGNSSISFNGFTGAGPFIQGGPQSIMGNTPSHQWESTTFLSASYPLNKTLLIEFSTLWNHLWMLQNEPSTNRDRIYIRLSIIAQRSQGGFGIFIDRNLHDNYPLRTNPVGGRIGFEFLF